MTAKRLILSLMTFAMVFLVGADLASSWGKPQFASRLGLYENDLRLHTSEWQGSNAPQLARQVNQGKPREEALTAYQKIRDRAGKTFSQELSQIDKLRRSAEADRVLVADQTDRQVAKRNEQIEELTKSIDKQQVAIDELDLRIGILQAVQGNLTQAQQTWEPMLSKTNVIGKTAQSLSALWQDPPQPGDEAILKRGLDSWFRYAALAQNYTVTQQPNQLASLNEQEQAIAQSSVIKLGLTGGISIVSLVTGIGVLIFVIAQRALKGTDSILGGISEIRWDVKWDWEIVWQVLILGFFFMGQVLLPVMLGSVQSALGFTSATMTERSRAAWILLSYLGLAGGGIAVLYGSIKSHLPLDKNWFQFDPQAKWVRWGLGGYFAAFPMVVGISLLNQQIWQGQGGSNPILSIAAQNHDPIALGLIFFTAAIAAPIFEETLFRGFLLPSLTRYMPTWGAILLSGFIFAIVHLSLSEVLPLMALAIVLGFVYTKTQNLMASMLLHSLWNSGTLVALFLLGGSS
ncbi:CPBP family intramembrane metalloprotease [filamentous cyanobacterium LEGE 11480]|uniref:CPBP family intramembrane metalloprotease n=1 Tax=Romeriopsis navalis LEGE 11480 TaxID=2777977 RepID=A0A928Z1M7_9CYAN|nr:CPBP family glutamic-type intramembrane protease [Romeriopsis navalis]MBE9029506.1 CPBP family intramembrane metalloprotease [Romeriopsis navalis LEGE 11480]